MNHLIIKVSGKNIHRFLMKLSISKIDVYDIEIVDNSKAIITINERDFELLNKIKGIYSYDILKNNNSSNIKKYILNNIHLLLILLTNVILFFFITNHIYEVEIIESNKELKEEVTKILEEKGIKKYARKKEDLNKITSEIISENKDKIEWIEIIPSGIKYIVKVEERIKNKLNKDGTPVNIVAGKSGLVKEIIASNGRIMVEKENYVHKGDVLISGVINENNMVSASGDVFAFVWKKVRVEEDIHEKKTNETGRITNGFHLRLFGKNIYFYRRYKYNKTDENLIFKNELLPIYLSYDTNYELNYVDHIRTIEETKNKALEKAKKELMKELKKDEKIISANQLKVEVKNSKIILDILFTTYENISVEEGIEVENVS